MCILHFMEPLFQTGHISSVLSSHVWLVAAVLDRIISGDCLVSIFFLADIPTADLHSLSLWVGWTVGMSHRAIIWGFLCFSSQLDFLSLDFRSFPHFCLVLLVIVGTWTKAYCWHIYLLSPSAYFWPVYFLGLSMVVILGASSFTVFGEFAFAFVSDFFFSCISCFFLFGLLSPQVEDMLHWIAEKGEHG